MRNTHALVKELGVSECLLQTIPDGDKSQGWQTPSCMEDLLSLGYFGNPELHASIRDEHAKKNFDAIHHIPCIMNFCDVNFRKWESLAWKAHGLKR
jgi:hypothetical protein